MTQTLTETPTQDGSAEAGALALSIQQLHARVLGATRAKPLRSLMLVGAAPGVGTSYVLAQWLPALVQTFGQVVVVELRPGLPAEPAPPAGAGGPLRHVRLTPEAVLAAPAGSRLPAGIHDGKALLVWDLPSPTVSSAALVLGAEADAVVLVAREMKTRRPVARHVADRLRDSGAHLIGVVLNRSINFIPPWIYRLL